MTIKGATSTSGCVLAVKDTSVVTPAGGADTVGESGGTLHRPGGCSGGISSVGNFLVVAGAWGIEVPSGGLGGGDHTTNGGVMGISVSGSQGAASDADAATDRCFRRTGNRGVDSGKGAIGGVDGSPLGAMVRAAGTGCRIASGGPGQSDGQIARVGGAGGGG